MAIIVAFVVVIHVQCLVSVYLSLVKIKYSVCLCEKKKKKAVILQATHLLTPEQVKAIVRLETSAQESEEVV